MNKYLSLIRFQAPFGWILLYIPCVLGILLGGFNAGYNPSVIVYVKFFLGAFLTRSAGCIINDILDRNFDVDVERTKARPIASEEVSIRSAIILMALLLLISFFILLSFPSPVILIGCFSVILMFIYPLFKRITYYPQVVLGFAFNIGVLMGFYAVSPGGGLPLLLIYGALIIWTVCYDTIYAMQDIKDDIKLGLKSTAVKFNEKYKIVLCALSLIFFVLLIAFWRVFHLGYGFLICSSLSFFVLNFLIIRSDTENFNRTFKLNSIIGLLLCLGVVV